jgi:hypothetical protein
MGIFKNQTQILLKQRIYCCVYYVRYLDSFLLGIRGPKCIAIDIKDEIIQFIKCNLQLEVQFAVVHYAKSSKVKYLGFDITVPNFRYEYTLKIKNRIAFQKLRTQLKQKKSTIQSRGKIFIERILSKKITKEMGRIAEGQTRCEKTIVQLMQRKNLNM